jgi:hypothetical protein
LPKCPVRGARCDVATETSLSLFEFKFELQTVPTYQRLRVPAGREAKRSSGRVFFDHRMHDFNGMVSLGQR